MKPGTPATIAMTIPAIAALLNNIPVVWAVPLAALIGLLNLDLSTMCVGEPAAMPTITAADWLLVWSPIPLPGREAAEQKFVDLIERYIWHEMCQCDGIATPAPPTPPAAPTGLPVVNPPAIGPTYPTGTPCSTAHFTGVDTNTFTAPTLGYNPLNGATAVRARGTMSGTMPTMGTWAFGCSFYDASHTFVAGVGSGISVTPGGGVATYDQLAIPPAAVYWSINCQATGGYDGVMSFVLDLDFYCGTPGPGGPVPQPCPPDQFALSLLEQILAMVTLIQRWDVPFGYTSGTVHAGVTGTGSFAVDRLLGMQVEVTAHTTTRPDDRGNPPYVWDQGWMSVMDANGMIQEKRITQTHFVWLPRLMQDATTFGYDINAGTSVTFTELHPEP